MLQVLVHKHIQSSEHFCEVDHEAIEELGGIQTCVLYLLAVWPEK